MFNEQFKPITDYEGLYSISNYGCVTSEAKEWIAGNHNSFRKKERTVLKAKLNLGGYLFVGLCKNGKQKYLGSFENEIDASNEYQRALKEFDEIGTIDFKGLEWDKQRVTNYRQILSAFTFVTLRL